MHEQEQVATAAGYFFLFLKEKKTHHHHVAENAGVVLAPSGVSVGFSFGLGQWQRVPGLCLRLARVSNILATH